MFVKNETEQDVEQSETTYETNTLTEKKWKSEE